MAKSLDIVTLFIVARILGPAEFGLFAIAMAVSLVIQTVLDLPIVQSLLRKNDIEIDCIHTAFTLSAFRGLIIAVLLIALSWPLAALYEDQRLALLLCVLSLAPIFRSLSSPMLITFMQDYDYRRELVSELVGKIASLVVCVSAAILMESYWALAFSIVTTPLVITVLSYLWAPYIPQFTLSKWREFKDVIGWVTVSQLFMSLNWQLDKLLLGKYVAQDTLGKYSMSSNISELPQQAFVNPLIRPLISAFSNRDDRVEPFLLATNAIISTVGPLLALTSVMADVFVYVFLGPDWVEAGSMLRWLSVSVLVLLPIASITSLTISMNQSKVLAIRSVFELGIKVPTLFLGIYFFAVSGALAARMFVALATTIFMMCYVRKLIQLGFFTYFKCIAIPSLCMVLMSILAQWLLLNTHWINSEIMQILYISFVSLLFYVFLLYLFWILSNRPNGIVGLVHTFLVNKIQNRKKYRMSRDPG